MRPNTRAVLRATAREGRCVGGASGGAASCVLL